MFPASSIAPLNRHRHHQQERVGPVAWYLVLDPHRFHVFVAARLSPTVAVRIDWHDNSTFCFEPYVDRPGETRLWVGESAQFCKLCIDAQMAEVLERYKLFRFNCRTVSYLVLTQVVGFDREAVYAKFRDSQVLCGLEFAQCFSLDEVHHYVAYREEKGSCALF